jgi:hypothetical protein
MMTPCILEYFSLTPPPNFQFYSSNGGYPGLIVLIMKKEYGTDKILMSTKNIF